MTFEYCNKIPKMFHMKRNIYIFYIYLFTILKDSVQERLNLLLVNLNPVRILLQKVQWQRKKKEEVKV